MQKLGMTGMSFRASGLDRAAHVRSNLPPSADQQVVALWRGKVACSGDHQSAGPLWLPGDHPIWAEAKAPAVFLGLDEGVPRFARDLDLWSGTEDAQLGAFIDTSVQCHPLMPEGAGFFELRAIMMGLDARAAELAATARAMITWHQTHRFCSACGTETTPAEAGWSRACPGCGRRHFPRTDPVVIMLVTHENDVLLGRSPGWPEGMYSLLAGFVEPGETLEAAAAREVFEEAAVQLGPVQYVACQPWPFPGSLMLGVMAEAETREIKVDPNELEDAIWMSREAVMASLTGNHPLVKPARKGAIARSLIEDWLAGRLVPGGDRL